MGWVDLAILVVLFGSAVFGYRRGLVKQVLELVGLAGGILLALYLTSGLVDDYTGPLAHYRVTYALVFLAIVGLSLLVAQAVGRVTSEIMEVSFFGWFDRAGGAVAGVVKGALWLSIWITILTHANFGRAVNQNLRQSSLAGPISRLLPAAYEMVREYAPKGKLHAPFDTEPRTVKTST